jgi:hypothetical protein
MLRVQSRLIETENLIKRRDQLKMAIDLDDTALINYIRRDMIDTISLMYTADYADAVRRYNDIVKGIDEVIVS